MKNNRDIVVLFRFTNNRCSCYFAMFMKHGFLGIIQNTACSNDKTVSGVGDFNVRSRDGKTKYYKYRLEVVRQYKNIDMAR